MINLETAVGDGKLTQSFEPESLNGGDPFTNWECESPPLSDSDSKPCITLPSRTAVSRLKDHKWPYISNIGPLMIF